MEAEIVDLDLFRVKGSLSEAIDPCSQCPEVSSCKISCERANAWWDQFAEAFNKRMK